MSEIGDVMNRLALSEDGQTFLRFLSGYLMWKESTMAFNEETGEINQLLTMMNESRRAVWIDLRQKLKPELRNRIEEDK